jgi:adenine-specific DNA-methyltransferase
MLAESGSVFVQIGDENVHRVRALMDEVFGDENFVSLILFEKSTGLGAKLLPRNSDYIVWYGRSIEAIKYRQVYAEKSVAAGSMESFSHKLTPNGEVSRITKEDIANPYVLPQGTRFLRYDNMMKQGPGSRYEVEAWGRTFSSGTNWWGLPKPSLERLIRVGRAVPQGNVLRGVRFMDDFPAFILNNVWTDTGSSSGGKVYVVQTETKIVERCLLMTTDPGDLVLDPTCGSGTTAYVAEQWGRRWITIDTSRVALALARARIMGARYPYYLLADSRDGQKKEAEITGTAPSSQPVQGNVRQGFVCERVPHITLTSIANNAEIDVIWEKWQAKLEPLREKLNKAASPTRKQGSSTVWQEWEIPREADDTWTEAAKKLHADWWQARIGRQKEIDASIAAKAEFEFLYDKPYTDKKKVRVAGPFTVESLSPHRVLGVDENDELIDPLKGNGAADGDRQCSPR